MVDLALKSMLHDKLRFLITISGVAFAVMLVFVQVGLFIGILSNASITIDHLDADLWVTSKNTPNIDFPHSFPESRVDRVRAIPGVLRADNLILSYMNARMPSGAEESVMTYALDDFRRWGLPWKVTEGDLDDLKRGPYMFLDASAEKRWGKFAVGEYREVLGTRMRIIGKSADALSFTTTPLAFMDFEQAQRLQPSVLRGNTTYMLVKLAKGADREAVRKQIAARLPYNDVFDSAQWALRSRDYWVVSTGLGLNMYMTVFLGCLVGVVVVAQTLYTSAMEHIKEFGTVKAIGGSNWDIYKILGRQAVIAAIAGFALGTLPAFALRPVMAQIGLKLIIPQQLLGAVLVGAVALCLLASLVSYRKIASIDPALVFRG
jgi:putative ABC transport system permease protein